MNGDVIGFRLTNGAGRDRGDGCDTRVRGASHDWNPLLLLKPVLWSGFTPSVVDATGGSVVRSITWSVSPPPISHSTVGGQSSTSSFWRHSSSSRLTTITSRGISTHRHWGFHRGSGRSRVPIIVSRIGGSGRLWGH